MAPRLPCRVGSSLTLPIRLLANAGPDSSVTSPVTRRLFSQTARHSVKYGWSTHPPRSNPHEFRPADSGLSPLTTSPDAALARKAYTTPVRTGVLAIKKGMSAMFVGKVRMPCTILQLDQVEVVATKNRDTHGYWAVQVGLGTRKAANVPAPQLGYYEAKGLAPKKHLAEFRVRNNDGLLPVGVQLQPSWFKLGQHVDVRATSKGKGFAGGMKRHGFGGQPASHGNSKTHRAIGSVGPSQGGGSRVHPGKKMPGRMGGESTTTQNLEVLQVDDKMGIVVVKGAVGGPKGGLVKIADAIKKKVPPELHRSKVLSSLLEAHPDAEAKLEAARKLHLQLKTARQEMALPESV
ncbi:54S ribosomal protein L9, mitochondrial [Ceratocystis lukuohia]|uniref:Large ribosomal subunit protein uL3m n=1 Tax=Ceratocystis lukuohia TaxID=2019550 RepID=A0ABR4MKR0_9PEZI